MELLKHDERIYLFKKEEKKKKNNNKKKKMHTSAEIKCCSYLAWFSKWYGRYHVNEHKVNIN